MRLLIDTNIFLEVILMQEKSLEAQTLLSNIEAHEFFISDYSLHSIGLLLFRKKKHDVFKQFLTDMIFNAGLKMISLTAKDMESIINTSYKGNLDFDDAYQYAIAQKYDLEIISFDSDFDRTEKGRKIPAQII